MLTAVDAAGKAYPPAVLLVAGKADLGKVEMGGCTVACGAFDGQEQTAQPIVVSGALLSTPVAAAGTVTAQYALSPPGQSTSVWNLAIPSLNPAETNAFQTAAGNCPEAAAFCATYRFTLPAQRPFLLASGGAAQQTAAPAYTIFASPASCVFGVAAFQQDGHTPLSGPPGAALTAADIKLSACK